MVILRLTQGRNLSLLTLGLTECVAEHFDAQNITKYEMPQFTKALGDFTALDSVQNIEDLYELGNLIFQEVVDASSGFVDYAKLRGDLNSQWKALVNGFSRITPSSTADHHKISFWVNAYNVSMMNYIVAEPGVSTVEGLEGGFGLFDRTIPGGIAGFSNVSLNGIEFGITRLNDQAPDGPFPNSERTNVREFRLHFAYVCGARACPKLRNFMFPNDATKLETVLVENTYIFFNSVYQVRVSGSSVATSELMRAFYPGDFAAISGSFEALAEFVVPECRSDKEVIKEAFKNNSFTGWEYDWTVNSSN